MLKNFHTHTYRCHHATGADEEYVKCAIERNIGVLGFSDHAPYIYPTGYVSHYKVTPDEAAEYCESMLALKEKYKGKIDIKLGFEAEYYPELFEKTLEFWRTLPIDYIILGQHFVGKEWGKTPEERLDAGAASECGEKLKRYADLVIEAIETGFFSYVAHPDIIKYTGDDREVFRSEMRRIARAAKKHSVPLEINLLGIRQGRHYPCEDFYRVLGEEGVDAIIGFDSHSPDDFLEEESYRTAMEAVERFGINLIDEPRLRSIL